MEPTHARHRLRRGFDGPLSPERVEGGIAKEVPEVLFVCVHNAGRSQMAASLLDHHAEGRVHVRSAGSTPAEEIDPAVVTVMDELGIEKAHAAGIATAAEGRFHMHKGPGLVRDVFRTRHMRNLVGNWGIGHCRYPTAGSAYNAAEAQPFYVNSPFGLMLAHNGNLTNADQLKQDMFLQDLRHMNTNSDSEVLLNVFAHELQRRLLACE